MAVLEPDRRGEPLDERADQDFQRPSQALADVRSRPWIV